MLAGKRITHVYGTNHISSLLSNLSGKFEGRSSPTFLPFLPFGVKFRGWFFREVNGIEKENWKRCEDNDDSNNTSNKENNNWRIDTIYNDIIAVSLDENRRIRNTTTEQFAGNDNVAEPKPEAKTGGLM